MAWDIVAVTLIPLAGFANFISFRGYDAMRPEVLLVAAWILIFAVGIAIVIALRPDSFRPLVFLALVAGFLQAADAVVLPQGVSHWLIDVAGPERFGTISWAIYLVPLAIVFFLLRDKLSQILSAAFGAMVVASFVVPHEPPTAITIVEQDVPPVALAGEKPPPLLHLIVDQQIGPDGLPPEVEGTPELRQTLLDFYRDHDFRLYRSAFTHFPATLESIPDLLNGAIVPSARNFIAAQDGAVWMRTNAWFQELKRRGYEIDVVQTDYMDFCRTDGAPASYCATLIAADIREIAKTDLNTTDKATLLFYSFFDEDFSKLARTVRLAWYGVQQVAAKIGISLPDWNRRSLTLSTIPALNAMDMITERASQIEPGQAIFAHILLPHDPYILDEDCRLKEDFRLWKPHESALWWHRVVADPQRRIARYEEYYKQVRCLHKKLDEVFDALGQRGVLDETTVIIHGDHGSRISGVELISGSEDLITSRDIVDAMSTLYAVRGPDVEPGIVEGQHSIQALFAAFALGRDDLQESRDIFLKDPMNVVGPNQTKMSLVPFKEE